MDLAEIEVFGTLMRVGTTIETARVLGLSQPAVSDRLKRMESRLGFLLFLRQGNRLVPSAEAEELFSQTSEIFAAQKEIRDRIEEIRANQERPITISATPALVEGFLAPRLARVGYSGWARTLRLWVGESDDDVRQGRADIGVQMALPPRADLVVETLCDIALVAVMQADHPLARKSELIIPDFRGQPLVSFDPDWSPMGAAIRRAFVTNGLEHRLACQVPFSSTVCHMVSACGGIGIIDAITAQSAATDNLAVRPIQSLPPLPLCAFHRRDKPLTARTQEVLLALKKL
ncbi:LysR family transcriptional regulator [Roseinatronobacter alkalisoli]|uniref:LysR family transcriptional regulator n=1 Tax=Roseinatronobacter alkalisoli TaxID=3028235 RepID=A0ABT5TF88_9RHOB|nr:LysR family transcriptional regulator [Roseinatronobacter sp. HJB301]MDD7973671.1 LysR family transcriptional regulator [Roseinatronobacter sp. HJB301]